MNFVYSRKDISSKYKANLLLMPFGIISIYSMIILSIIMDISLAYYQFFYFDIFNIPKIKTHEYIIIDRHKLSKLNFMQKINCVYCCYVNGLMAFGKAIANQTELYNCAIKHAKLAKDSQYQTQLEFEEYQNFK